MAEKIERAAIIDEARRLVLAIEAIKQDLAHYPDHLLPGILKTDLQRIEERYGEFHGLVKDSTGQ